MRRKKQPEVLHRSTEAVVVSVDVGLRIKGLFPLVFRECIAFVLPTEPAGDNFSLNTRSEVHRHFTGDSKPKRNVI